MLSGRAAKLDAAQVQALLAQVPAAIAHASLDAFADFLLRRDNHIDSSTGSLTA